MPTLHIALPPRDVRRPSSKTSSSGHSVYDASQTTPSPTDQLHQILQTYANSPDLFSDRTGTCPDLPSPSLSGINLRVVSPEDFTLSFSDSRHLQSRSRGARSHRGKRKDALQNWECVCSTFPCLPCYLRRTLAPRSRQKERHHRVRDMLHNELKNLNL